MCVDSDKKILPLCHEHVIAMSSRKVKEKYDQLVFSEICFKTCTGNLLEILFEVFCRFLLQAKLACFNEQKTKME